MIQKSNIFLGKKYASDCLVFTAHQSIGTGHRQQNGDTQKGGSLDNTEKGMNNENK